MKKSPLSSLKIEKDDQASSRKQDHIDLAFKSAVECSKVDNRFLYEPMLSGHPDNDEVLETEFLSRKLKFPIWVSSMTGGTEKAKSINTNLAKICGEFGLGMGLGSCRQLLYEDKRINEFDIRPLMPDAPLCINLGIAQIEELIDNKETERIEILNQKLSSDGLIIHINPLQEWLQPEGDKIKRPPIDTILQLMDQIQIPLIIKEVGQGFGYESLKSLLALPLEAVDLAGFGGTNFSRLELLRSDEIRYSSYKKVYNLGHSCYEMLSWINDINDKHPEKINCSKIIFSGGVKDFLDGYYFIKSCTHPSIYAQASGFLKYALDYAELSEHVKFQIEGLKMANKFLEIKH